MDDYSKLRETDFTYDKIDKN